MLARESLPKAIFLMGATATGKTALAMSLCKYFPCEIISVDSALIYQGMDIGTAKPSTAELELSPHFLIDIISPEQSYSAWEFRHDALRLMNEIHQRGHVPLLVGGTMLYFNALENGLDDLPQADSEIRQQIENQIQLKGLDALHEKLRSIDPDSAQKIKKTDRQRISRALEVFEITGQPLSQLQSHGKQALNYDVLKIILSPGDRKKLHENISVRFQAMLQQGLLAEVEQFYRQPELSLQNPSMRCVGYRQVWEYLDGQYDYEEMIEKANAATRQLAKRQITWLRKHKDAHWFDSDEPFEKQCIKLVGNFLN